MASLLAHIGLGGIAGAAGAVLGGLIVLALRVIFTSRARARTEIRELGIVGAAKRALFDLPQSELDLSKKRATSESVLRRPGIFLPLITIDLNGLYPGRIVLWDVRSGNGCTSAAQASSAQAPLASK